MTRLPFHKTRTRQAAEGRHSGKPTPSDRSAVRARLQPDSSAHACASCPPCCAALVSRPSQACQKTKRAPDQFAATPVRKRVTRRRLRSCREGGLPVAPQEFACRWPPAAFRLPPAAFRLPQAPENFSKAAAATAEAEERRAASAKTGFGACAAPNTEARAARDLEASPACAMLGNA